jgi:hypothetical protein
MNNRHQSERAVVVLKWHPPREMNGRLVKYTLSQCRPRNTDGIDAETEEVIRRRKREEQEWMGIWTMALLYL